MWMPPCRCFQVTGQRVSRRGARSAYGCKGESGQFEKGLIQPAVAFGLCPKVTEDEMS